MHTSSAGQSAKISIHASIGNSRKVETLKVKPQGRSTIHTDPRTELEQDETQMDPDGTLKAKHIDFQDKNFSEYLLR